MQSWTHWCRAWFTESWQLRIGKRPSYTDSFLKETFLDCIPRGMVFLALAFKVIISDLILIGWVLNWHAKLVEWLFKTWAMIEKSLAELNPSPCPGWPSFLMDLPDSSKTVLYLRPLWGRPGGIRVWLSVIEGWCGFDPWMIDLGFDHSLQPIISNPIRVIDPFFFWPWMWGPETSQQSNRREERHWGWGIPTPRTRSSPPRRSSRPVQFHLRSQSESMFNIYTFMVLHFF